MRSDTVDREHEQLLAARKARLQLNASVDIPSTGNATTIFTSKINDYKINKLKNATANVEKEAN